MAFRPGDLADGNSTDIRLDTSGGNYNFTLTATAGNNPDLSGAATVDIQMAAAQLQVYESDGSMVLGHSGAVATGGWVPGIPRHRVFEPALSPEGRERQGRVGVRERVEETAPAAYAANSFGVWWTRLECGRR